MAEEFNELALLHGYRVVVFLINGLVRVGVLLLRTQERNLPWVILWIMLLHSRGSRGRAYSIYYGDCGFVFDLIISLDRGFSK